MPKRIDMTKWQAKYLKNAKAAGKEWHDNFLATTGIAAAAASDEAQDLYETMMRDDDVLARRQRELAKLSDEDFKRPVRTGGSSLYTRGIEAKADKAAKGFAPYAEVINTTVAALPARTADPETNVTNRVLPIVLALAEKKRSG